MTTDHPVPAAREPGQPPRTRSAGIAVVLAALAIVVAFVRLVSRCGTGDEGEIYGAGVPTAAATGGTA